MQFAAFDKSGRNSSFILNNLDKSQLIYLNAQLDAIGFYKKLGFVSVGIEFEEAGIQHQKMTYKKGE